MKLMPHKTRVFLVDDHPLVREWLATLINQQADLETCGEAFRAAEASQLIGERKPEVAIVDLSLEVGSGIELIKDIKTACADVANVVSSMHDESLYAERAFQAGARGYVMKREIAQNVLQAIRCVLQGQPYLNAKIASSMAAKWVGGQLIPSASPAQILSGRELEVFQLIGRGYGTRQISENLSISMKTVQAFCARIKEKLNLANATELLRAAVRWHDNQNAR